MVIITLSGFLQQFTAFAKRALAYSKSFNWRKLQVSVNNSLFKITNDSSIISLLQLDLAASLDVRKYVHTYIIIDNKR